MVRVLVIDDEKECCDSLKDILTRHGYEVSIASSGPEAIQKVKCEHPHLILLDILMPGMDGIEILKEIRRLDKDVLVTIVSVVRDSHTTKETMRLGAVNYMTKPLDLDLLERSIQAWAAQVEMKQLTGNSMVAFDFDEQKCKTIIEIFLKKGYNIQYIESLSEVDSIKGESVHLAFVRADLLGEATPEIIQKLKSQYPKLPIAITVKPQADNKAILAKINEIGSCHYIGISFEVETLVMIVYSLLVKTDPGQGESAHKKQRADSIMVIDDDSDTCDYTQRFLTQSGYRVYTFTKPKEALKEIASIKPDLVLLDIVMPDMDGLEVLKQIKSNFANIQVIMLTGVKDDFICQQAIESGACDYLVKPFSLDQLKASVLLNALKIPPKQ